MLAGQALHYAICIYYAKSNYDRINCIIPIKSYTMIF